MPKSKRRQIPTSPEMLVQGLGENKIMYLWRLLWYYVYRSVNILTYVLMILGYGLTAYAVFTEKPLKAVLGLLLTMLSIYINKSNPS